MHSNILKFFERDIIVIALSRVRGIRNAPLLQNNIRKYLRSSMYHLPSIPAASRSCSSFIKFLYSALRTIVTLGCDVFVWRLVCVFNIQSQQLRMHRFKYVISARPGYARVRFAQCGKRLSCIARG